MRANLLSVVSLVGLMTLVTVSAVVIPGHWEKVDALPRGALLIVTLNSGEKIDGTFLSTDSDSILLETSANPELALPKSGVARIVSSKKVDDRLRNGALIGAGVGFAAGFFGLAAFNAAETASGPIWDGESVGVYVGGGILGAGAGALTGALVDKAHKGPEELYRAH